jgi:hypothetical protein
VCGKSARTVPLGGGRQRTHGDDYTGTKLETADTAKSEPTEHRDGPRPSRITLKKAYTDGTIAVDMDPLSLLCRLCHQRAPTSPAHPPLRGSAGAGEPVEVASRAAALPSRRRERRAG